jgi:hypothetical protein
MNRPQKYERTDPWKQYPWDDPDAPPMSDAMLYLWCVVCGFVMAVIVLC